MEKKTVKRRIFLSNTWMVFITLLIFLCINVLVVRGYAEWMEHEWKVSMANTIDEDILEEVFEDYTIHRNEFILLILADGVLCIGVLVLVSQIFTKNLVRHIMKPLNALTEGAKRIRGNDLTQNIEYEGDAEFEEVCYTFNDMRKAILKEQEKNRKYEKARTDMIAGISHDLRTPLTALRGTIKGLLDGVASTPIQQQKFLQTAYRRTGDMDLLLNQLFYVSKLETGNMPINLQMVEISEFIKNYVKGKQELLENERIEVTAVTKGITGNLRVDPEQLCRIFDNLLENSRKYGEKENLKIKITLDQTGEALQICFSDNGIGVAEEKLPYIFDEFYRADESRNKKEGNGLGLYIVKHLTEGMGGEVSARSADGFTVCMRFKNEDSYGGK